jgi:hypothetical protein
MVFPLCIEVVVRDFCNHFDITANKGPCVVDGLAGLSLWVCLHVYICVCVYMYIYIYIYIKIKIILPLWARQCSEVLVRSWCNHLEVTADKRPCVVDWLAGLSLCVCVCVYVYINLCVCICIYIYIYINKYGFAAVGEQFQRSSPAWVLQS